MVPSGIIDSFRNLLHIDLAGLESQGGSISRRHWCFGGRDLDSPLEPTSVPALSTICSIVPSEHCFLDSVSCSPRWLGICCKAKNDLEFLTFLVLGLQMLRLGKHSF